MFGRQLRHRRPHMGRWWRHQARAPARHQRRCRWHFASGILNMHPLLSLSDHGPTQSAATCSATRSPQGQLATFCDPASDRLGSGARSAP
eukprot:2171160-Prymnesium_polylepis.1